MRIKFYLAHKIEDYLIKISPLLINHQRTNEKLEETTTNIKQFLVSIS
jgi:hypothetical protein